MNILKSARATKAARFAAVTGVVAASLIGLSSTSAQAAATAATLTPATGPATTAGTVVSAKGKGFQDATLADLLDSVSFETTACAASPGGTAATNFNVTSATEAVITVPSLAANTYYVCFFDTTPTPDTLLGQGTYTTAAKPAPTTLSNAVSNVLSAPTAGGSTVTVTGTNFTKSCKATVDGVAAKTTYVSATALSIVLPAHAATTTNLAVRVTGEYGYGDSTDTIAFYPTLKLGASSGGTATTTLTITGAGFSSYTWEAYANPAGTTTGSYNIGFLNATETVAQGTAVAGLDSCASIIVVSDTKLTCKTKNNLALGAYTVVIYQAHTTTLQLGKLASTFSKSATYTVKVPADNKSTSIAVKANGFAPVNFEVSAAAAQSTQAGFAPAEVAVGASPVYLPVIIR